MQEMSVNLALLLSNKLHIRTVQISSWTQTSKAYINSLKRKVNTARVYGWYSSRHGYKIIHTKLTELSCISSTTLTLSSHTVAMVVTVRNFTFIVANWTFCSFPSWVASACSFFIFSIITTENWACTCRLEVEFCSLYLEFKSTYWGSSPVHHIQEHNDKCPSHTRHDLSNLVDKHWSGHETSWRSSRPSGLGQHHCTRRGTSGPCPSNSWPLESNLDD